MFSDWYKNKKMFIYIQSWQSVLNNKRLLFLNNRNKCAFQLTKKSGLVVPSLVKIIFLFFYVWPILSPVLVDFEVCFGSLSCFRVQFCFSFYLFIFFYRWSHILTLWYPVKFMLDSGDELEKKYLHTKTKHSVLFFIECLVYASIKVKLIKSCSRCAAMHVRINSRKSLLCF